jgi:hypothetical protein
MEHSPLPWKVEINEYGSTRIMDKNYDTLYAVKSNAQYIVEACNAYPSLIEENKGYQERIAALEEMLAILLERCRLTSSSIGKTGHRLFGSDDFMMVYEDAENLLDVK